MSTEDEVERLLKIINDPQKLQAAADRVTPTPYTEALTNCNTLAERLLLSAQTFGNETAGLLMRFDRIDAQSLREAAAAFDKADMTELAAMAREAASEAKLKEPAWRAQSKRQRRASKAAYRKAIEKACRKA